MASRSLKVYQTHIGFYDVVVAAPSMKAAAEAWGSSPRIFAQGFAKITQDPDAVTSALAQPGVVLRRPHGQRGHYKLNPDAPALPKVRSTKKREAAKAAQARKIAEEKRAQAEAEKRAERQAKDELKEIEQEEARLRDRRQALQRKFHLRSV